MSKTLKESAVTTPNARADLSVGLHWRGIEPEVHLGYRKGKRGGVWLVRWRSGLGYRQVPLGTADDKGSTKVGTLPFADAVKKARTHVEQQRAAAVAAADGPILTVRAAVEAYVKGRDDRDSRRAGRMRRSDAAQRLGRYVIGQPARGNQAALPAAPLADLNMHALKDDDLLSWRASLPIAMKATTQRRLCNDLKAALNSAYRTHRKKLPAELPATIKHGLSALDVEERDPAARDNQILTPAEIDRLLRAAREIDQEQAFDGDLFRIVLVLAATGARFSQVTRITVDGCQVGAERLMVPSSRKGKSSKTETINVPVGRDVLEQLLPAVTGRKASAPLLERWRFAQAAGGIEWRRAGRSAWRSASELSKHWHVIRARAALPEVIPYALRHSSIVRAIRANLPLRLVAALHDTSTEMIERHYAKWITSGLEDMARAAIVPLVPQDGEKVITMRGRA